MPVSGKMTEANGPRETLEKTCCTITTLQRVSHPSEAARNESIWEVLMGESETAMVPAGIEGLDDILRGGFPEHCLFLVTGAPGTGKTSLAMQLLLEGVTR